MQEAKSRELAIIPKYEDYMEYMLEVVLMRASKS